MNIVELKLDETLADLEIQEWIDNVFNKQFPDIEAKIKKSCNGTCGSENRIKELEKENEGLKKNLARYSEKIAEQEETIDAQDDKINFYVAKMNEHILKNKELEKENEELKAQIEKMTDGKTLYKNGYEKCLEDVYAELDKIRKSEPDFYIREAAAIVRLKLRLEFTIK